MPNFRDDNGWGADAGRVEVGFFKINVGAGRVADICDFMLVQT